MNNQVVNALKTYAQKIRDLRRANADVAETALAPAFQQLCETLLPLLPSKPTLTVVPEFNEKGVGRPDIALIAHGAPPRAFVELKAPSKPADPTKWKQHDKRQYERFQELYAWSTCNFFEFRLLVRDKQMGVASVVPELSLDPTQTDKAANTQIDANDAKGFVTLFEQLCGSAVKEPVAKDAKELATLLAHSARFVRGIIKAKLEELGPKATPDAPLLQVRHEFKEILYAHPEAGGYSSTDFDDLFSAAFAQTLAFGLLLVKEATCNPVGADAWKHMPDEHPMMKSALRVLSMPEIVLDVGIGFDVICDTVNSFAPEILAIGKGGHDPILYFYEDFLETFDPEARERYGVYYTPVEVVRYIVSALDKALRDNLETAGMVDPAVTILDPATGTGTFMLGVAEHVRQKLEPKGAAYANEGLRNLATRMFGLELLIGPYAVAHYRLHHALAGGQLLADGTTTPQTTMPRLGVFLADTLAEPGTSSKMGKIGFVASGINDERREADRVKAQQPVLAILGNPPYRRLKKGEDRTLAGPWMNELWEDLKEPVRLAGKGGQLNTFPELAVAFWRWSIWKMFESENAPERGVIAYITNRKFLTGWPYAGLRKMMREKFDRIEIYDLRGDGRAGERAGVEPDQNVFNIQVGVAITIAIADGSKAAGEAADIVYHDAWEAERFRRKDKLGWLVDASDIGTMAGGMKVERDWLENFRPEAFQNGEWVSLRECFLFALSGIQTKRDHFSYATSKVELDRRLKKFTGSDDIVAEQLFSSTSAKGFAKARAQPLAAEKIRMNAYRPFDQRALYNSRHFIDRHRPELQAAWGDDNVCLYAMPSGTGEGPGVWCHNLLPDYHSFRGSYGGYAMPLYDRRAGHGPYNIAPSLIENLSVSYGNPITGEDMFHAILCLLSATSYTLRFAEDLEDTFPHVPFPAQYDVFMKAGALGKEIRALQGFQKSKAMKEHGPAFCRLETEFSGNLKVSPYHEGKITLCDDGSGEVSGIPSEVWDYEVSGYRVLDRWLDGREGQPLDFTLFNTFQDICGRIAALIEICEEADIILEKTLADTLTRAALVQPMEDE